MTDQSIETVSGHSKRKTRPDTSEKTSGKASKIRSRAATEDLLPPQNHVGLLQLCQAAGVESSTAIATSSSTESASSSSASAVFSQFDTSDISSTFRPHFENFRQEWPGILKGKIDIGASIQKVVDAHFKHAIKYKIKPITAKNSLFYILGLRKVKEKNIVNKFIPFLIMHQEFDLLAEAAVHIFLCQDTFYSKRKPTLEDWQSKINHNINFVLLNLDEVLKSETIKCIQAYWKNGETGKRLSAKELANAIDRIHKKSGQSSAQSAPASMSAHSAQSEGNMLLPPILVSYPHASMYPPASFGSMPWPIHQSVYPSYVTPLSQQAVATMVVPYPQIFLCPQTPFFTPWHVPVLATQLDFAPSTAIAASSSAESTSSTYSFAAGALVAEHMDATVQAASPALPASLVQETRWDPRLFSAPVGPAQQTHDRDFHIAPSSTSAAGKTESFTQR